MKLDYTIEDFDYKHKHQKESDFFDIQVAALGAEGFKIPIGSMLEGRSAILIINTATSGKFQTTDMEQMNDLVKNYPELLVLAFPCNDFGNEPGRNYEIFNRMSEYMSEFCIMEKVTTRDGPK